VTRPTHPTPRSHGPVRTMLGRAVLLTVLVGLVAMVVAGVAAGADGVRAALVGVGLVLAFLLIGQLPVAQVAAGRRVLAAGLLIFLYSTRLLLVLMAFRLVTDADAVDRKALGLSMVACALAWTAGTVWTALRWRPTLIEPETDRVTPS
jgi:hypothetical protein